MAPGATSPSDVTVDVNDNDESVVYADTVRLVSTLLLKRLTAAVTGDSAFDQLAVMSSGKDVTGWALVASDAWLAYFRAVWDVSKAPADIASGTAAGDGKEASARFVQLLEVVETGAAYKKPGPAVASQPAALQLLNSALVAQAALLDAALQHAATDAEFEPHSQQLQVWRRVFGVLDGGVRLMDNVDRITAA